MVGHVQKGSYATTTYLSPNEYAPRAWWLPNLICCKLARQVLTTSTVRVSLYLNLHIALSGFIGARYHHLDILLLRHTGERDGMERSSYRGMHVTCKRVNRNHVYCSPAALDGIGIRNPKY
jgi:hypothetical protein